MSNMFHFDKANAEARAQRIRNDVHNQQLASQFTSQIEQDVPSQYHRRHAVSVFIVLAALFALFLIATPASAQDHNFSGVNYPGDSANCVYIAIGYWYMYLNDHFIFGVDSAALESLNRDKVCIQNEATLKQILMPEIVIKLDDIWLLPTR